MPDSLREQQETVRKERRRAKAWWRNNRGKLKGEVFHRVGTKRRIVSLPQIDPADDEDLTDVPWESWEVVFDEAARFVPVQGLPRRVDVAQAAMSARVKHVLSFLTPAQREVLTGYYVAQLPWRELRGNGETRQSFHERLAWARKAFLRELLAHGDDPVVLREEDF